jgi:hypothetical protein
MAIDQTKPLGKKKSFVVEGSLSGGKERKKSFAVAGQTAFAAQAISSPKNRRKSSFAVTDSSSAMNSTLPHLNIDPRLLGEGVVNR